jgi:hypothetical protein
MFIIINLRVIILLIMGVLMSQAYSQPANLVLQDTTIATAATFTATNSITAGPNFTISSSGNATFVTGRFIYFRPGIVIIQGGKLKTITDSTLVNIKTPEAPLISTEFIVHQNYPNPFNPITTIKYNLPKSGYVRLKITNLLGQKIKTLIEEWQTSGYKTIVWDGADDNGDKVCSGIYFYSLIFEGNEQTKKMLLMQ